jgi:predicted RNA-binding Zn ribbon-like protein
MKRIGGALALDFCNTMADRTPGAAGRDHLARPEGLAAWAALDPAEAAAGHAALAALRTVLDQLFDAAVDGVPPPAAAVAGLQHWLDDAAASRRLVPERTDLTWRETATGWRALAHRLTRDAVAILTGPDRARLKRCPGDHCGWLFLDRSKNRSRQWCTMADCGNIAKVRRHRHRT